MNRLLTIFGVLCLLISAVWGTISLNKEPERAIISEVQYVEEHPDELAERRARELHLALKDPDGRK